MKLKFYILLSAMCTVICLNAMAQTLTPKIPVRKPFHCGSSPSREVMEKYREGVKKEADFPMLRDQAFNFPVVFHIVRHSDGTGGITAEDVAQELAWANAKHSSAGIEFFQCSPPQFIDDDNYFNTEFVYEWDDFCGQTNAEYLIAGQYNVSNVINIYYVHTNSGWNWSCFPDDKSEHCKDWIIMDMDGLGNDILLAHELGHYFNLLHTFQSEGDPDYEEHITRNPDSDCYNCSESGDYLCDTEADNNEWNSSCAWNGSGDDGCTNLPFSPDPKNIMSYAHGCEEYFTAGQIGRMDIAALTSRAYLECPYLSDCQSSWNLSSDQNFMFSYQATDFITSTATINSGVTSSYDAANYVLLKAGFFAPSGCDFRVLNEGCWGPDVFKGNETEADVKNDEITSASFSLYPNPAGNLTHLVYKGEGETYTIIIHDALGQNVFQKTVSGAVQHEMEIDLSDFQKGIYFVSLNTESGVETLPLIIQ